MRLIDADALIRILEPIRKEEIRLHGRRGNEGCCTLSTALLEIENAPTIEERKTGKWIRNDNGTYSCSLCQSWIPEEQYYYARFCLYCGADMRGEDHVAD